MVMEKELMGREAVPQVHIVDLEAEAEFDATHYIPRSQHRSDRRIGLLKAIILVLTSVLVTSMTMLIAIPETRHVVVHKQVMGRSLHSLLSRTVKTNAKTVATGKTILMPLYMYPGNGASAWQPLITAAQNNPLVNFVAVINVDNGPTSSTKVETNFKAGITALSQLSNVKMIGYVPQGYGSRDPSAIQADINMWVKWKTTKMYGIGMKGIFFDEMPDDAEDMTNVNFVGANNKYARAASSDFTFIMQNPGTIPDMKYFTSLTGSKAMDATIILEDTYATYTDSPSDYSIGISPAKLSFALNSIPDNSSVAAIKGMIPPLLQQAKFLWMSDLSTDFYENWGDTWANFVSAFAQC